MLGLALMSGTAERASAAPITGRVFHDYNTNGRFDTDAAKGAVDTPVGGMLVRVFTGNDTEVARATTAADGTYTVNAPNARVRVALSVAVPWWPTRQLNGLRSDEHFVDATAAASGVDFGVHQLREWTVDNPYVFWPLQWGGPPSGPEGTKDAIRGMPYFTTPLGNFGAHSRHSPRSPRRSCPPSSASSARSTGSGSISARATCTRAPTTSATAG